MVPTHSTMKFGNGINYLLLIKCYGFLCLYRMPARSERDPDYRSVISLCCDAGCGLVAAMESTHKHS